MAFGEIAVGFLINIAFALVFALINVGLFYLSGIALKMQSINVKNSLLFGAYIGVASLAMAYINFLPVSIVLILCSLPIAKYLLDREWDDKNLYFAWLLWLLMVVVVGFIVILLLRIV